MEDDDEEEEEVDEEYEPKMDEVHFGLALAWKVAMARKRSVGQSVARFRNSGAREFPAETFAFGFDDE